MAFTVGKVGQELRADLLAGDFGCETIETLLEHTLEGVFSVEHASAEQVQDDLNQLVDQFGSLMTDSQYDNLRCAIVETLNETGINLVLPPRDDLSRLSQYNELTAVFQGQKLLRQAPLGAEPFDRAVQLVQKAMQRLAQDGKVPMVRNGADGRFGPETRASVVAFQKQFGLGVDGVIGKNTLNALNSALKLVG